MAQTLRLKRSSVPGRVPTTATLQTGEIAINTADGLVYIRKDDDTIIPLLGANTTVTGSVVLLGSIEATSFTGSFNGPINGTLSKTVGSGNGIVSFLFDGSDNVTVTLDTGSDHFRNAVIDLIDTNAPSIIAQDTTGPGGIDLSYNSNTGALSGSLLYSDIQLGSTTIQLGNSAAAVSGFTVTGSFRGNVEGTASWANNAVDAISASHALIADQAISASFTTTASYSAFTSQALSSSYANFASQALSSSYATTASYANFASNAQSASYATTASYANFTSNAESSSYAQFTTYAQDAVSASYAATASSANDFLVRGDLNVDGIVTAREFHTTFVSASIVYSSGSTKFGDTADDLHEFTGSVVVSGSIDSNDITIDQWGSVSASLASISASASTTTLQQVTDNGNSTTLVISASNLNITDFPDVSASLAALGNYNLQDITDNGNSTNLVVSASNLNISGFPDVSASLAALSSSLVTNFATASSYTLQDITDNGNATTLVISASNLNITDFPDVSSSLADLYDTSASLASELTLVSATASAAYNYTLQDITDNGNSTNLVISASNLNITGFPDVSASLAALESSNTLQGVTDNGNTTTNEVIINNQLQVSQSIYSKGEEVLDFAVAMAITLG